MLKGYNKKAGNHVLIVCCSAHLVQDGLVALQYVLLPILAQTFGLNYTQVGSLRAISNVAMTVLEIPAGMFAERTGERRLLVFGLVAAAAGFTGVALATGYRGVALFFLLAGAGAAFQHSLASALLVRTFDNTSRRRALGTYNASGDSGKLLFTAFFSLGVGAGLSWKTIVIVLAVTALCFAFVVWYLLERNNSTRADSAVSSAIPARWGINDSRRFSGLGVIVFLDSMSQAVFLTFLAFIFLEKGATESIAALAVVVALTGGMVGKFSCGFLAARLGDRLSFIIIQMLTVAGIVALIYLPVMFSIMLLPWIGMVMQGSSTVTYGSVADIIDPLRQSRGYALIYTLASASSVFGPFLFGLIADKAGLNATMWVLAIIVGVSLLLSPTLSTGGRRSSNSSTRPVNAE